MNKGSWFTKINNYSGWRGSLLLGVMYVASELPQAITKQSDWGGFVFVTLHFVIMPILSLVLIALTTRETINRRGAAQKIISLSSLVIPCAILLVAITGDAGLGRVLSHPG